MIERSESDSETSDCPPPVFVPEGRNGAAQSNEDDEPIIPINAPEGEPPNIHFIALDDAPVVIDSASLADSYNRDEPDPEHLCQSTQIWECQSGCLQRTDKFTCTFGPNQIPISAARFNCKKLKCKQHYSLSSEIGDSILNAISLAPPTIEDFIANPLSKFITFAANYCGYRGSFTEIFVTAVHPFFLKAKTEASKEDNPDWHQAMNGPFADEYFKAAEKDNDTLF